MLRATHTKRVDQEDEVTRATRNARLRALEREIETRKQRIIKTFHLEFKRDISKRWADSQ